MNSLIRSLRGLVFVQFLLLSANHVAGQAPVLTNAVLGGDGLFHFQVRTVVGQSYTIQTTTQLPDWTEVGTLLNVETNLVDLTDPRPVTSQGQMFYRIKVGVELSFRLHFLEYAEGGQFQGGFTPAVTFPIFLNSYSALLNAENDTTYDAATNVFFTGPAGSGLTNTPADPSNANTNNDHASYQSPYVSNPVAAPGGTWTVQYKGTNHTLNIPDPQAASRLVIPVPTASVSNNVLQSVSWIFKNASSGATLAGAPPFLSNIQVQIDGTMTGRIYDSHDLSATTTNHTLSSTVNWSEANGITMAYEDSLENQYVVSFRKQ
jgi:hypothetical protein